ncbi:transketolase family protein [Streptomyces sp. NBC_01497]|uniref:transketolase family protein n=1 Tax=Streptomyces sp. NBC_01497 TaxID=2903885 RepID=UPI002E32C0C6|nr:transketolase C-terminal domain-containing protein [Streptomyces sp. NBC_01497]
MTTTTERDTHTAGDADTGRARSTQSTRRTGRAAGRGLAAHQEREAGAPGVTREAYRDRLMELLPDDPRLMCLDTDTGLFGPRHTEAAGERYVNLGIAEHNLMGIAAGLASLGRMPFVNTMAGFASARALEAVKVDIAYPELPVRIMATHGGLAAGHLGPTHQALEDLTVMRALPTMTVVVPADAAATAGVVEQSRDLPGPMYVRLGRKATPAVPCDEPAVIGRAQLLRPGTDVVLVGCGPHPVTACTEAAELLAARGVSACVLNMHTLRPLDTETLLGASADASLVVTVEEHWRSGGLGGAVCEALAETRPTRVLRIGMPDRFSDTAGSQQYLLDRYGITAERTAATVMEALEGPAAGRAPAGT